MTTRNFIKKAKPLYDASQEYAPTGGRFGDGGYIDNPREVNPIPTALLLSLLGSGAGLGASYLTKNQRKHKLRNALIGGTALPAAYLLLGRDNELAKKFNRRAIAYATFLGNDLQDGKFPQPIHDLKLAHIIASRDEEMWPDATYSSPGYKLSPDEIFGLIESPQSWKDTSERVNARREQTDRAYRNLALGLAGTSGLLGLYGMGQHAFDKLEEKYGPAPEGVDKFAYYDFLEKQEEAKRIKELEKQRSEGIKALLANKPKDVSPSAYKDFLNAQYNV